MEHFKNYNRWNKNMMTNNYQGFKDKHNLIQNKGIIYIERFIFNSNNIQ